MSARQLVAVLLLLAQLVGCNLDRELVKLPRIPDLQAPGPVTQPK